MQLLEYMPAKKLLDSYGIRSVACSYVDSKEEAAKFAKGTPVAMKVLSGKALHKSKSGLVKLNLIGDTEVKDAYSTLSSKAKQYAPYKIIEQKMAKSGVEIIIGGRADPQFGKLIILGLGGVYVEVFKDVALRVCPITKDDAEDMVNQLKSKDIVTYNGANKQMLISLLLKVSKMLQDHDNINELDLNPVIIRENDYDVVDIRILK